MEILLLIVFAVAVVGSVAIVMIHRYRVTHILDQLDVMLTTAMDGTFCETVFDESRLSAIESRMAHYLSTNLVSERNLQEEKDTIKELIADISHQTKTPLTNILLYVQLLKEQSLGQESSQCLQALEVQTEKLRFLVDSLVKVSRLEAGVFVFSRKNNPIYPLIESIVEQVGPKATAKQVELCVTYSDACAVYDPKWTAEALYNIMDNAVKYTLPGGSVTIEVRQYQMFARIDITDTGIGIEESEQAEIFGRFYRSEQVSETEGVGIGLFLAREIISGQGGYIKVRSEIGLGSCFSVFLPLEQ